MKKFNYLILLAFVLCAGIQLNAQKTETTQNATLIVTSEQMVEVPSIASQIADGTFKPAENIVKEVNPKRWGKNNSVPGKGLPKGNDPLLQKQLKVQTVKGKAPILTFEAASSGTTPTDPTGAVGPNHFVNAWNSSFRIWDKAGNPLTPAAALGTILNGNAGDPIVFYDRYADRFIITEFYSNGCGMAVCQGPDPVNDGWYLYLFNTSSFPDYPKFSVWSDGYYITANKDSGSAGTSEVVFATERDEMLVGNSSAQMVGFPLTNIVTSGFYSPLGFNCNGPTLPPAGNAPIVYMQDDVWNGVSADHLKIWTINVNWTTPASSTISNPQIINTSPFDGLFDGGSFSNLVQPSGTSIDALQATIMYMAQYRRFSGYNSVVFNFVVDPTNVDDDSGIRWYELRQINDGDPWTIYQEGTYIQPDGHSAFSGNMCMDASGNIALAYTTVSPTQFPSLRYTGRFASDPLGTMTLAEEVILNGTQSDPSTRYGDYSQMTIDPTDDATFWSIGEVFNSGTRKNHVGVFQFAPPVLTAEFNGSPTNICSGGSVSFTDASLGSPASWNWSFPGGSPGSYNGQTPPAITYSSPGTYNVSLTVGDGVDTDTETIVDYITVQNVLADFSGTPTSVVVGNTVTFTDNSSCNPTGWNWSFPGGTPATATGVGPHVITYNTIGTYNVSLTATKGGSNDTELKTGYITVIAPEFNIINGMVTTCTGNFYDSGGAAGDYANNEDFVMTFYPSLPSNQLEFTFNQFDVEYQSSCNFDYLNIYNGENTSASLIGQYCGTNSPGTVFSSNASGAITFEWHSDVSVTAAGWSASINCFSNNNPPVAEFSASATTPVLNADVIFTDLSTDIPTSWNWSFNPSTVVYVNGTDATSQNPEVQFTELGLYTVTLTATNAYGFDTEIKTNYINVVMQEYCIPTYSTGTTAGDYITLVQLGDINNVTGASASPYYTYYSALSAELTPDEAYTITLSPGTYDNGNYIAVWIDYNQNQLFELTEKLGTVLIPPTPTTGTIDFTVPSGATSGTTRMRVREVWNNSDFDPCETYSYGETEDYNVNILGGHVTLDLKAYLEGPFNGTNMNADIVQLLPLSQPFTTAPWNYTGAESVGAIPNPNVVEWVLIDVRDAATAATATSATSVAKQAAFILRDGSIVDLDGSSNLQFDISISQNMFVVVMQRNHLGIISNDPITPSAGVYTYDFTTGINQVFGGIDGHKEISIGIWGMIGGDANHDGTVNINDKSPVWENEAGEQGYLYSDHNLDGETNNQDKDDIWVPNENKSSQVPD